jgi:thiamine biosynthesis protein ThiS
VAAVVNDRVVPAAEQAVTLLAEGDRVELLTFAGGG